MKILKNERATKTELKITFMSKDSPYKNGLADFYCFLV